jgi:hypothetical protein
MKLTLRDRLDHFFVVTKKGYDDNVWIFILIGSGAVITKLFGISGTTAVLLAFVCFYVLGRLSLRSEKRLANKKPDAKKS